MVQFVWEVKVERVVLRWGMNGVGKQRERGSTVACSTHINHTSHRINRLLIKL